MSPVTSAVINIVCLVVVVVILRFSNRWQKNARRHLEEATDTYKQANDVLADARKTLAAALQAASEVELEMTPGFMPAADHDQTPGLPSHCYSCGAFLMGGATEHAPDCDFRRLIESAFPKKASE